MPIPQLSEVHLAFLPVEVVRDNFIIDYSSSYEEFLVEFVNNSSVFLKYSYNELYQHTPKNKQNHGEYDCTSKKYKIDFKLLCTQSELNAIRNLSPQKICEDNGEVSTWLPLQFAKGRDVNIPGKLLRTYSLDKMIALYKNYPSNGKSSLEESDVFGILKTSDCSKNVLFFCSDFVFAEKTFEVSDIITAIEPCINDYYANLFRFRERLHPNADTVMAIIVQKFLCIAVWENNRICFKEWIPLTKSDKFQKLLRFIDGKYLPYLS